MYQRTGTRKRFRMCMYPKEDHLRKCLTKSPFYHFPSPDG
jgi:hypothetical protein